MAALFAWLRRAALELRRELAGRLDTLADEVGRRLDQLGREQDFQRERMARLEGVLEGLAARRVPDDDWRSPPAPARRRRTEPLGRTPQLLRMASTQVRQIRPASSTSRSRVRHRTQVPNAQIGSARAAAAGSGRLARAGGRVPDARLAPPTPEAVADTRDAANLRTIAGPPPRT